MPEMTQAFCSITPGPCNSLLCSPTLSLKRFNTNVHDGGDERVVARHLVSVSTKSTEGAQFGIDAVNMLESWDCVGVRYSMMPVIGLSTMAVRVIGGTGQIYFAEPCNNAQRSFSQLSYQGTRMCEFLAFARPLNPVKPAACVRELVLPPRRLRESRSRKPLRLNGRGMSAHQTALSRWKVLGHRLHSGKSNEGVGLNRTQVSCSGRNH
jgi:hypothetical protein